VTHSKSVQGGDFRAKPIHDMLNRCLSELTGERNPADAWRQFITPADVVGIKINPVGQPAICSSSELLHAILAELQSAGVKPENIVVYERYRMNIERSPYFSWVPKNIRLGYAANDYEGIQMGIEGYDPECYVELPFALPGYDAEDAVARRSHAALFISKDVTKLINLPVLKSHNAAGVTLALKNLSHGLVNNVSRSHDGPRLRYTEFVPAVVNMPVIRQKTVLNILDGTKGLCHGGPGYASSMEPYIWEHKTIYAATDPVALDVVGRSAIEARRKKMGLWALSEAHTDGIWSSPFRQPEHIESAGQAGLGEWDPAKIDVKRVTLG
jgi:uncharacterized protein (DUF362 family)